VSGNKQARGSSGGGRKTPKPRRPLPPGQALYTPQASPARQAVERRSAALLVYLHQLPRWVPPVVLAVLLIAGLAVHGIGGAIALIGVALVLAWLALVSWPQLSPAGRAVRTMVIALVIGVAVVQVIR
jgi:O-antigen ligase